MPSIVTDALVLHTANYLESSRIFRLVTREAGLQSVVARGARTSKKRFGSAVDLFALGQAQIDLRPGRELNALTSFDVTHSNAELAGELGRFSAASAIAECALRVIHDEAAPTVFDGLRDGFFSLASAAPSETVSVALGGLWRLVRDVGVSPALEVCADCHTDIAADEEVVFSHASGGVLCPRCVRRNPGGRRLPASARASILAWMRDESVELSHIDARSHQRLLREFIGLHLTDGRPLKAFSVWEHSGLEAVGTPSA
jgi:DNA repair protein RecO (recombination protein O)